MKTLNLIAVLALATAAPAVASASISSAKPDQCVRQIDRLGNVRVVCPNLKEARLAWGSRRPSYRGNYVVYYHDGRNVRMWKTWTRPMPRR